MGQVIQFIPRSERERVRLIREARAIYDSIFPPAAPLKEQAARALTIPAAGRASALRTDEIPS